MTMTAPSRIAQVCNRIEADLAAPWRTADLAREAGMTHHHFQRQFAAYTGKTVAGYIRSRRLKRAAILLHDMQARITDITLKTLPVTVLDWPVVTLPIGRDVNGLPMGPQLVGKPSLDGRLLSIPSKVLTALL